MSGTVDFSQEKDEPVVSTLSHKQLASVLYKIDRTLWTNFATRNKKLDIIREWNLRIK
jgi:hypothetical protein